MAGSTCIDAAHVLTMQDGESRPGLDELRSIHPFKKFMGFAGGTAYCGHMASPYHPPVKRSVEIAGHKTSVSLEPVFWDLLKSAAGTRGVPINALIAHIDAERIEVEAPTGLAGAIRLWLVDDLVSRLEAGQ